MGPLGVLPASGDLFQREQVDRGEPAQVRRLGVLQGNNLPYQRYEHHFKVVPQTYKNRRTGETVPTATTFVRPAGVEFLRKKLTQSTLSAPVREAVDA